MLREVYQVMHMNILEATDILAIYVMPWIYPTLSVDNKLH